MQTWVMEDVPVSDDSRVVYFGRDIAASSLLSQSFHSSFPVALKLITSLFFSLETTLPLLYTCSGNIDAFSIMHIYVDLVTT